MMQINRALVLLTGKIDISSLCDENKQIFECISERNHFELAHFQFLDDLVLRKEIDNKEKNPVHFEKDSEYNAKSHINSTNLKKGKLAYIHMYIYIVPIYIHHKSFCV